MRVFIPGCPKEEIANKHFQRKHFQNLVVKRAGVNVKSHSIVFIWSILASQTASIVLLNLIIPSYNLFQEFPKCLPCTSFLLFNKKIVVTF